MFLYLILGGFVVYVVVVRCLRYRRIQQMQSKHGATPQQFKNLNYKDAQTIVGQLGIFECPWMFLAGKDFAFLRAFAIPGISNVSVGAREMVERAGKRYADTTVLVGEFLVNDIDSERACVAINRMNWIHSRYGSKFQMDQMIYTLCLLACEALQWIDRYDWRPTTPLEKHASWVFWNEVGRRMGLTGVPPSFAACAAYIAAFEARHMAPSPDNARIAQGVLALYASAFPAVLAPAVKAVVVACMEARLRAAFQLPARLRAGASPLHALLVLALAVRRLVVRHLMLPRRATRQVFGEANAAGFRPMEFWEIEPWYVASSTSGSWLYAAYARFFGLPMAGDAKFQPEGYKLQEIGPRQFEGKGGEEVMSFVTKGGGCSFTTFGQFSDTIYTRAGSGCPISLVKGV